MRKIRQLIGSKVEELRQNVFVIRQLVARDKEKRLINFHGRAVGDIKPADQYGGDGAGVWEDVWLWTERRISTLCFDRDDYIWIIYIWNNDVFECTNVQ